METVFRNQLIDQVESVLRESVLRESVLRESVLSKEA